jgi:hypothetical protein
VVAVVFVILLAIGLTAALVVHRTYVAYEPRVARHVPSDVTAVARFDLTHVMFYEPFRRSIFPLVDHLAPAGSSRRDRLTQRGIRVGADIREVLWASGPSGDDWLVALAGPLPREGVASTLESVLREEGVSIESRDGVFVLPASGVAFGQAEDGTFVLASSSARLRSALAPGPAMTELQIGAGGFLVKEGVFAPAVGTLRSSFRTGSVVQLDLHVTPSPAASATGDVGLRALLQQFGALDPAFERPAEQAAIERQGNDARTQILLPREAVERVAALAAARGTGSRRPDSTP